MFYILYSILSALCMYFSCINLLPEKFSISKKITVFLALLITIFLFSNQFKQATTIILFFIIIFLLLLFSQNKWLNLSCALFGYIFCVTLNYLCIWIAQFFLHMNLMQMAESHFLSLVFSTVFCLLCFIITKVLKKFLIYHLKIDTLLTDSYLNFTIFLSLMFLSGIYILNFSYGEFMGYSYSIIAFSGILYLLLFTTIAVLMYNIYRKTLNEEKYQNKLLQYDNLQVYTSELEKLYSSMRQFKHDYINILTTLSAYIDQENTVELKEYFHSKILPASHDFSDSDTKLGTLSNIKILPLKSLLSSKIIRSLELDIKTEIEIKEPVCDVYIEPIDFSRIVGIFLDNAIEAAAETDDKILRLCMILDKNDLITIVENTTRPLSCPLDSLTDFGVSSKGTMRGVGLNNVKNIVEQHQNIIWDTEYTAPFFTQRLITTLHPPHAI